jgi:hypothetical protein
VDAPKICSVMLAAGTVYTYDSSLCIAIDFATMIPIEMLAAGIHK